MESFQSPRKAFSRVKDGGGQFACVHNSPPATPSHTSLVGEVVFGWGSSSPRSPEPSERAAEVEVDSVFNSAAGKKTGRIEYRPLSKCRVQAGLPKSAVDLLSYSSSAEHLESMTQFDKHAGFRSSERVWTERREMRKKQGVPLSLSVMDQVVFGHDIDGSGEKPHERFTELNSDHAGTRREERFRHARPGLPVRSTAEAVLYGKEAAHAQEGTAGSQTARLMSENAAGLRPGEKTRRRKTALQMVGRVDEVFNRASPGETEAGDYNASFRDHAGVRSPACVMRAASCPPQQFATLSARSPPRSLVEGSELGSEEPPQTTGASPQDEAAAGYPGPLASPPLGLQRSQLSGSRRPSSMSSCTTASQQAQARATDRKPCLDDAWSVSSRGSLGSRPRWR